MREIILKYVLQSAILKGGKPHPKGVMGKIMADHPHLRGRAKEVYNLILEVSKEVESMSLEEQRRMLEEIAPEMLTEEGGERKRELALRNVRGNVVMRFAPNPSGPLHLGHSRAAVLNDYFVKKYGGKFILRLEDTDPKRVLPEAYEMIEEDLEWLNIEVGEKVIQSERMEIYYHHCERLIEMGHAYVCQCDPEEFRRLKNQGIPCRCRERSVEENLELWERMLDNSLEGAVVRLKTDIKHKNPSVRDFPIFRMEDTPHPRTGDRYIVYPLMNFSVPVDDHLLGITHVLRGKDHIVNTEKQRYIFQYFQWEMPEYIHYGILKIEGTVLSTSKMYQGILKGEYRGWDDPRLGTLRALRRRGIRPEAIYRSMLEIGIKPADVKYSWENLYAINREIVDKDAKRFFFVENPKRLKVLGAEPKTVYLRMHPDRDLGTRELPFEGEVYISDDLEVNKMYRLMELCNIVVEKIEGDVVYARYHSEDFRILRRKRGKIIHWVPVKDAVKTVVVDTEGRERPGFAEKDFRKVDVDEIVQFERYGFARVDEKRENGELEIICYFAHK
ncbi:MAG TPA: glutamate--tRNA ligase [Methanothermococcus okinawensis]|uniref:Glutamate--tRNA ligase n=1 Tax=Methanothermococcus okinawensis TaxID=155863 RepID=A0A832ZY56_9EURY|nr:glutamate--tRNA ligase [Methanothermococcus okinawensis]